MSKAGRPHLRLLLAEIALPLLLVAGVEAGFRWYLSRPATEIMPRLFSSPLTTGKYLVFRERAASEGAAPIDVLLMGMSQMMRVSATELSQRLAEHYQRPITTFNFAAPGHTVEFDRRLLEDIVLPLKPPRVVVYGLIPQNLFAELNPEQTDETIRPVPAFTLFEGTPDSWLRRTALDHSRLLLYREAIQRRVASLPKTFSGNTVEMWVKLALQTNAFGDTPAAVVGWSNPELLNVWERSLPKRFQHFDALMRDSVLFANLGRLAAFCREHGIRLVLALNDVNPLYLYVLPKGRADYQRYVDQVRFAAQTAEVPLFTPIEDGVGDAKLFVDATHHNRAGMRWVTEELAKFLIAERILDAPS